MLLVSPQRMASNLTYTFVISLTDEKLADKFDAADNGEPGGAGGPGDFPATSGFPGGAPGGFYGPEEGPSVEEVNYIYLSKLWILCIASTSPR